MKGGEHAQGTGGGRSWLRRWLSVGVERQPWLCSAHSRPSWRRKETAVQGIGGGAVEGVDGRARVAQRIRARLRHGQLQRDGEGEARQPEPYRALCEHRRRYGEEGEGE